MISIEPVGSFNNQEKSADCISANGKAKSEMIADLVRAAKRERLNYDDFLYVCRQARKKLGLRRPKRKQTLPKILSEADLRRFFDVVKENVEHEIMLKLIFFTALRVSELTNIKVTDVDLGNC